MQCTKKKKLLSPADEDAQSSCRHTEQESDEQSCHGAALKLGSHPDSQLWISGASYSKTQQIKTPEG